jgi:hypothetical protein
VRHDLLGRDVLAILTRPLTAEIPLVLVVFFALRLLLRLYARARSRTDPIARVEVDVG